MVDRKYIDWDSPQEQEAAMGLVIGQLIDKNPDLEGAHPEKDENGFVFAVKGNIRKPVGHISNCLELLEHSFQTTPQ